MDLSEIFTSQTLKAQDLQGHEPTVTIETVTPKQFENGMKLILTFVGKKKALVANKTNSHRIALIHGSDIDKWPGKKIQLYTDIVDFQGKAVEAIRVRPIKDQPAPAARKQMSEPKPEFDDPVGISETF